MQLRRFRVRGHGILLCLLLLLLVSWESVFKGYVRDRISQLGIIPSLSTIIREKSSLHPLGLSWQLE